MVVVAVVGSRSFGDYDLLRNTLDAIPDKTEIVSGGAIGADELGERYAREHNIPITIFLPDWKKYRRAAGPIRNRLIVDAADHVIAFWDGESRGTLSGINLAKAARKKLTIVRYGTTAKKGTQPTETPGPVAAYRKHVAAPWLAHLMDGSKAFEGRVFRGDFTVMRVGEYVEFYNEEASAVFKILSLDRYDSFASLLESKGIAVVLPGCQSIAEGVKVYAQYYADEDVREHGVVAIGVELLYHNQRTAFRATPAARAVHPCNTDA